MKTQNKASCTALFLTFLLFFFYSLFCNLAWPLYSAETDSQAASDTQLSSQPEAALTDPDSAASKKPPEALLRMIQEEMLAQNYREALRLCLEAQRLYPENQEFRDKEASIRDYLLATLRTKQHSEEKVEQYQKTPIVKSERLSLKQRLVLQAKQSPLLNINLGIGLTLTGVQSKFHQLSPFSQASIELYFSRGFGVNLFYFGSNWELPIARAQTQAEPQTFADTIYSLSFGGSLRFRNNVHDFLGRGSLSFSVDLGFGMEDAYSRISDWKAFPVFIIGFYVSDRPFYHFLAIQALAGLQMDLSFTLHFNMLSTASPLVQTGNFSAILWQSLGKFRLGLSYRVSYRELFRGRSLQVVQHQFAVLFSLEWRASFE